MNFRSRVLHSNHTYKVDMAGACSFSSTAVAPVTPGFRTMLASGQYPVGSYVAGDMSDVESLTYMPPKKKYRGKYIASFVLRIVPFFSSGALSS